MRRNAAVAILGLVSAIVVSMLVAITPAAATATPFAIASVPPLSPAFSPTTPNYVVACSGHATTHVTTTGSGATVVGGKPFPGRANVRAHLIPGQSLTVTNGGRAYVIRCLPADFPQYLATVKGKSQTTGVLVTPTTSFSAPGGNYVIIFDAHGVPVWWYRDANVPIDAKFFGTSTIGWASGNSAATGGTFVLHSLKGTLQHTVGGGDLVLDEHDMQRLPNGNYLGIIDVARDGVDLSSWGLSSDSKITDNEIVELDANNNIVWSWSVADHINLATANTNWRDQFPDIIHMNSIQYLSNHEIIFSARHLDAVYAISMDTGAIIWKLGGTTTPQSLTVLRDQYASVNPDGLFSGQHDARIVPGGTLTVQDNGTRQGRSVRALRFAIDPATKTATEVQQLTDSRFTGTVLCCGGVDRLTTGDWLASWGTANYVTELTPKGVPVFTVSYAPYFSYRVAPVAASIAQLRHGMDAMVPPLRL
jgi:hypothetical protein